MTDVRDEVRNFLMARSLPREDPADLTDETPLIAGGILDPAGVAELAAFLAGRFGIAVEPHEAGIPHLDSVAAIARLVTSRWGREAAPPVEPGGPPVPVPAVGLGTTLAVRANAGQGRLYRDIPCVRCGTRLGDVAEYAVVIHRFDTAGIRGASFAYHCVGCAPAGLPAEPAPAADPPAEER
jgi:acyl carrier protein